MLFSKLLQQIKARSKRIGKTRPKKNLKSFRVAKRTKTLRILGSKKSDQSDETSNNLTETDVQNYQTCLDNENGQNLSQKSEQVNQC